MICWHNDDTILQTKMVQAISKLIQVCSVNQVIKHVIISLGQLQSIMQFNSWDVTWKKYNSNDTFMLNAKLQKKSCNQYIECWEYCSYYSYYNYFVTFYLIQSMTLSAGAVGPLLAWMNWLRNWLWTWLPNWLSNWLLIQLPNWLPNWLLNWLLN